MGCLPFRTPGRFLLDLTRIQTPDFDILIWHCFLTLKTPWRVLRTGHGMLIFSEQLIPLLFCKKKIVDSKPFFVFVLSFSWFQIWFVSLDFALLFSYIGILYRTITRTKGTLKTLRWLRVRSCRQNSHVHHNAIELNDFFNFI